MWLAALSEPEEERPMHAVDIMTTDVITVSPTTSVQAVARLLADKGISAVPVVDAKNRLIGMVIEGDLLHRGEIGTERRRPWWLNMIASTDQAAGDYVKTHSHSVADVMTRDVLSVEDTTSVADIALLLETNRIKRVPVLRAGKLVGIVSRANLIRALAMTIETSTSSAAADDRSIRNKLLSELKAQSWAEVAPENITVKDGVIHLWCSYSSEREKKALLIAAQNISGVRHVKDHMRAVPAPLRGLRNHRFCVASRTSDPVRFLMVAFGRTS